MCAARIRLASYLYADTESFSAVFLASARTLMLASAFPIEWVVFPQRRSVLYIIAHVIFLQC